MKERIASFFRKSASAAGKLTTSAPAKTTRQFLQDHLLTVAAIGCVSAGVSLIYLPAGLITLGLLLFLLEHKVASS